MANSELFEFCLEYFKCLDFTVTIKSAERIEVLKAPMDFIRFIGKSPPYCLVFDTETHTEIEDSELINKGSFFLKSMRDFLQNKAQRTLLKMRFDIADPSKEIKKELELEDCKITMVSKSDIYDYLIRYTYTSTCQYLNEKVQRLNTILLIANVPQALDLEKFELSEGSTEDINLAEIQLFYEQSVVEIGKIILEQTSDIQAELQQKLDTEIERVKKHYEDQNTETDEDKEYHQNKLQEVKSQLRRAYYQDDKKRLMKRVQYHEDNLTNLEDESYVERLERERKRLILDEVDRYSLNIDNKLLNISLIYYPTFTLNIDLESKNAKKSIKINYNPLLKKLNRPLCDSCKKETKKVHLCSDGHLSCEECIDTCAECKEPYCKSCLKYECSKCKVKLCKKCAVSCPDCKKIFCKEHLKVCNICDTVKCVDCLVKCPDCGKIVCKNHIKICSCGNRICEKCAKKKFKKCSSCGKKTCDKCSHNCSKCDIVLCHDCTHKCTDCEKVFCDKHSKSLKKCNVCNNKSCNDCSQKCQACGKVYCKKHIKLLNKCEKCKTLVCKECSHICAYCKKLFCKEHVDKCSICNKVFCNEDVKKAPGCGHNVCRNHFIKCKKCGSITCPKCVRMKKHVFGLLETRRCIKCIDK